MECWVVAIVNFKFGLKNSFLQVDRSQVKLETSVC